MIAIVVLTSLVVLAALCGMALFGIEAICIAGSKLF